MQDITEWTNTSITHNLSRAAGHPIVQVDDYFYSQIFSLCCYLDHFPPFVSFHCLMYLPLSVLSYHWVEINTWISQFISHCSVHRQGERWKQPGKWETNPLCSHYHSFLKFPSHKVLPKPFLCYLKTFSLRTSLLPGECAISLHEHYLPANRHLPPCLCSKYTQTFFTTHSSFTWGWNWTWKSD